MFFNIMHPPCELSEGQLPVFVYPLDLAQYLALQSSIPVHLTFPDLAIMEINPFFNEYNLACPGSSITYTLGEQ